MSRSYKEKADKKRLEKYAHPVILALWDKDGQTKYELKKPTKLGERAIGSGLSLLEDYGMVRGAWEKVENSEDWQRRYWISGEGTRDYIITIRDQIKKGIHRYLPYDHKAKKNMKGQWDEV